MRCAITGAIEGIGRALAERFARGGNEVVGIDRQAARRDDDAIVLADLLESDGIERALEFLASGSPCDVFVHNAGTSCVGRFETSRWKEQRCVVELNLLAPMLLTAGLLREGLLAPRASLVFVSSLSRFVGYPGAAGYAASKDGLASYARSLAVALAPRGMHVLTVYPGPTRTEHARRFSPRGSNEARRMSPERLAELVFRSVGRRKRVLVPGGANQLFAVLGHVLPRLTDRAMGRAILTRLDPGRVTPS